MKTIREILSGRKPIALTGKSTVLEAVQKMNAEHVGAVLVEHTKGVTGVFSERDLMTRVVEPGLDPATTKLAKVMTKGLFSVTPERYINEVAREMQTRHIRHLPVIEKEGGEVIEMLSLRDLLREHLAVKRDEVKDLTAYIKGEV